MKKTSTSQDFVRYSAEMYSGMVAGLLVLSAIASCTGLAGSTFEFSCVLLLSLLSSTFCLLASETY